MKNITLSADEYLIQKAREKAHQENATLNAKFREWLERYVMKGSREKRFRALIARFSHVEFVGERMTRNERNER